MATAPLKHSVLEAAARWYVQLQDLPPDDAEHTAWRHWIAERPEHQRAWQRVQMLEQRLRGLPADLALPALAGADAGRRAAIKTLVLLLTAAPLGWAATRSTAWHEWTADHHTQTGEHRQLRLADCSRVHLNTATAIDVDFSADQRLLQLHQGEILVETAPDPGGRPFLVQTAQGSVRALGTRFTVRTEDAHTEVSVIEHAVEIRPAKSPNRVMRLEAGHRIEFTATQAATPQPGDANLTGWTHGMLVALDWRLADFIAELARYRPGYLGCDPAVAQLRISGAFRLGDIDGVLDNLAASLPVRIKSVSRYWVRVVAR